MKKKKSTIVRMSAEEIDRRIASGEDQTDWDAVDKITQAELEEAIRSDPDEGPQSLEPGYWGKPFKGLPDFIKIPKPKVHTNLRIDADVYAWFKKHGRGFQSQMNAVLRAYYEMQKDGRG